MPDPGLKTDAIAFNLGPALAAIERDDPLTLADQRALTEIASPPGGEAARGAWLAERLRGHGLHVRTDAVGNVLAHGGAGDDVAPIVLAAHLDTVFPPETDVRVREAEGRLLAPGISDNSRGLAALLRLAAILPLLPRLRHPLLLAGTVGEEGAGDLRGVKHLFRQDGLRPAAFIAVDGAGLSRVVVRAVGSRRLRVRLRGPGGHSWQDRGTANPLHALAAAVAALAAQPAGEDDDVALNVGRMGGGTSVNAIPEEAWLELDLRSESPSAIARLERAARESFESVVRPPLLLELEVMGDRPAGSTPEDHPLVWAALVATDQVEASPELVSSSTDANVPMSLGIPAITLGAGGRAGAMHTVQEWYGNERGAAGIQRLLLTLVLADLAL